MDRLTEIILDNGIWVNVNRHRLVNEPKPVGNLYIFSPPKPNNEAGFSGWILEGSNLQRPVTFEQYAKLIEANAFEKGEGVRIKADRSLSVPFRFYQIQQPSSH